MTGYVTRFGFKASLTKDGGKKKEEWNGCDK